MLIWAVRLLILAVLVAACEHFDLPGLMIGGAAVAGFLLSRSWSPKTKASLATWKSDEDRFTVDFKAMTATIGGFGLGSDLTREALAKRWEEEDAEYELRRDQHGLIDLHGWTKEDWTDQSTREFQIRRKDDAVWEMRLTYKYFCKREVELTAVLKAPTTVVGQMYAAEEFEKMFGFTWKQWLNSDAEPLPPGDHRPWQRVGDHEAAIETSYQRYVHQG